MSRENTEKKIIDAVAHLLATKGFQAVGINAIAREAGVDKVLIYRYFDNLPTLLKTFAQQKDYWPSIEQLLGIDIDKIPETDTAELLIGVFTNHLNELRKRPITQAIMCWQLSQRNELTDAITKILEEQGIEFLALAPAELKAVPGMDVPAVLSLIHAGITFLILRSKTAESFGGIDLQSEEGWKRVENGIQVLVKAFIAYCRSQKETDQ